MHHSPPPISPFSTLITIPTGWTDFQYDDKGNVTKVTKPNNDTIEFKYYATGKRAKKIITVGSTVTTYKYHWDGDLPVKIDKTVGETTTSTYFTFRKPGDILTMTVGESTYFYVQNIRGDVVALMDSSGNQVASYVYDTWGKPTISNPNNLPNPFLYQGSYATFYDDEFGMYGMGARTYNPLTMRFVSRDLNHGTLTNTMSQNLYIYCYNNPLGFKDPSGFSPVSCGVAGGIVDTGMPASMTSGNDGRSTPIPDSAPNVSEQAKQKQEAWDWIESNKITDSNGIPYTYARFEELWNTAKDVCKAMKKWGKGLDKNDMEIAFMVVLWNDKSKLGLSMDGNEKVIGLVGLAMIVKSITYLESTCGLNTSDKARAEGLMGVESATVDKLKNTGWVIPGMNMDFVKSGRSGVLGSLYQGIGVFLSTTVVKAPGFPNTTLSGFQSMTEEQREALLTPKNVKSGLMGYAGTNGFVIDYFKNRYPNNWRKYLSETTIKPENGKPYVVVTMTEAGMDINPYGNAVWDMATTGSYKDQNGNDNRVP